MNWVPGSPRPIYFGSGIGKRSQSLAVVCPVWHCRAPVGVHCTILKYTHWGYERETVQEFHQERIDLSKLCQCGNPSTLRCDALIKGDTWACHTPLCESCAITVGTDEHLCATHAKEQEQAVKKQAQTPIQRSVDVHGLIQDTLHNLFCGRL